jgi:hypothetical protein
MVPMQQALDRNTLDRLIALGRQQGFLTNEDLRVSLPVDSMSTEELALIMVHLEESGIPVELEDDLLSPNQTPRPVERMSAEIIPFPGPAAKPRPKPKISSLQKAKPPASAAAAPEKGPRRAIHWIVAAAGLLAVAVVGLVIFASSI